MARGLAARGWTIEVIAAAPSAVTDAFTVHSVPPTTWPSTLYQRILGAARAIRGRSSSASAVEAPAGLAPTREQLRRRADTLPIWQRGQALPRRDLLTKSLDALISIVSSIDWAIRARRVGSVLLEAHQFDAIIVSTPPHTTQLVGRWLSRRHRVPYFADYRDPWATGVPELTGYDSPVTRIVGTRLERFTQRAASVVVHNNPKALERALQQRSLPQVERVSIANGYDAAPTTACPDGDRFRILFSGWIHSFMDPRVLLRAVSTLRTEEGLGADVLRLEFIGSPRDIEGMPLMDLVAAYGLADCTTSADRVSREDAMRAQEGAAVLVAFDCPHPLAVAMKFYDYLLMRGDLLLIAEVGSALDLAAQQVGWRAVAPSDERGVVEALRRALQRWRSREYPSAHDPQGVFQRDHRTEEFHQLLTRVADRNAPRATPMAS